MVPSNGKPCIICFSLRWRPCWFKTCELKIYSTGYMMNIFQKLTKIYHNSKLNSYIRNPNENSSCLNDISCTINANKVKCLKDIFNENPSWKFSDFPGKFTWKSHINICIDACNHTYYVIVFMIRRSVLQDIPDYRCRDWNKTPTLA